MSGKPPSTKTRCSMSGCSYESFRTLDLNQNFYLYAYGWSDSEYIDNSLRTLFAW